MKEKTLCDHCLDFTTVTIHNKELTSTLKNVKYTYFGKVAVCDECGNEIYVGSVNDHNLLKLYDEYRRVNNIISLDDVRNISKKYNIGKRPLSNLLGWGELTYSRYCDGNIPTKQFSDELKRINDDPTYYLNLLEENKDKLGSELAYKKSKTKVLELINEPLKDSKMNELSEYIIFKCKDITPNALQIALYYSFGFYYAFFKEYLFDEDCIADINGLKYEGIARNYNKKEYIPITPKTNDYNTSLSENELMVVDEVVKYIACYRTLILESFIQNEITWIMARTDVKDDESNTVLDKSIISNYFLSVKENYDMESPKDIRNYVTDLFEKV